MTADGRLRQLHHIAQFGNGQLASFEYDEHAHASCVRQNSEVIDDCRRLHPYNRIKGYSFGCEPVNPFPSLKRRGGCEDAVRADGVVRSAKHFSSTLLIQTREKRRFAIHSSPMSHIKLTFSVFLAVLAQTQ